VYALHASLCAQGIHTSIGRAAQELVDMRMKVISRRSNIQARHGKDFATLPPVLRA